MKSISESQKNSIIRLLKSGKNHLEIAKILQINSLEVSKVAMEISISTNYFESNPKNPPSKENDNEDCILIGFQKETKEKIFWAPRLSANPHLMIVGQSGYGKTYAITSLVGELNKLGNTVFIIDYSKSYSLEKIPIRLRNNVSFKEIQLSNLGLSINPLEIREEDCQGIGPVNVAIRITGTFKRIYKDLGDVQLAILKDVILDCYNRRGIYKSDKSTWRLPPPYLYEVEKRLSELVEDDTYPQRKVVANLQAHISDFFEYNIFRPDGQKFHWKDEIKNNKVVILQLSGMPERLRKIITEFLLWDMFSYFVSEGEKPLHCFVVLDEAHNLSFQADTPIDKILRESRKFGLGAILATQQLEDLSDTVYTNTDTKMIFQVTIEKNKYISKIASKIKLSLTQTKEILTTLPKFHVLFINNNSGIVCKVASIDERRF